MLTANELLTFQRSVIPSSSAVYPPKWHKITRELESSACELLSYVAEMHSSLYINLYELNDIQTVLNSPC